MQINKTKITWNNVLLQNIYCSREPVLQMTPSVTSTE